MKRGLLLIALILGAPAIGAADSADAPQSPDPAVPVQIIEPGAPTASTWTMTMDGRMLGHGVGVGGSSRKFLEDYDTLGSGAGAATHFAGHDALGNYFEGAASILGLDAGRGVDGAGVHVRGGHRGLYTLTGDFTRSRSFFDDRLRHGGGGTVVPARLGQDLDLVRTNGRLTADVRFGARSRFGLVYDHRASDGDESLIKASPVESLGPFAFRFPAFKDIDVRADAVDAEVELPAGPLDLRLTAGWTDVSSRSTTHETGIRPDLARAPVEFTDDIDTTIVRAGIDVATPTTWNVLGHAGYRFLWMDADADASQSTGSVLERTADGISVTERSYAGHTGMVLFPLPHLLVRSTYTIVDQHRDGSGREQRRQGASLVSSDTDTDVTRHRQRLEISYTGLPRTRLRATYRYEHRDRDTDVQMLGAASDPLGGIDRIQQTDDTSNAHHLLVEGRWRVTRPWLVKGGYRYRREDTDEDVDQLLNEDTLGDRHRESHTGFLGARYRWGRRATFEAQGELLHEDYDRTDIPGDSSTALDAQVGWLRTITSPLPRLLVTSLLSVANRDYDVGTPRQNLGVFAPIQFHGRSLSSAVAARYAATDRVTLGGRYTLVDAAGSLDNIIHRVFLDAGYRVSERLRVTTGYAYLSFDQGLYRGPDYDAHLGWLALHLDFPAG